MQIIKKLLLVSVIVIYNIMNLSASDNPVNSHQMKDDLNQLKIDVVRIKSDMSEMKTVLEEQKDAMFMLLGSVQMILGSMQLQVEQSIQQSISKMAVDGSTQTLDVKTPSDKRNQLAEALKIKPVATSLAATEMNKTVEVQAVNQKKKTEVTTENVWARNQKVAVEPNKYQRVLKDRLQDTTPWSVNYSASQVESFKDIQRKQETEKKDIEAYYVSTTHVVDLFCKVGMTRELGRQLFHRALSTKQKQQPNYTCEFMHQQFSKFLTSEETTSLMDGTASSEIVMKILTVVAPEHIRSLESLNSAYYKNSLM